MSTTYSQKYLRVLTRISTRTCECKYVVLSGDFAVVLTLGNASFALLG